MLAWILFLGLAVRVLAWIATAPTELVNDEFDYLLLAQTWVDGGDLNPRRPPATPVIYGTVLKLLPGSANLCRGVNVVLGSALVALAFVLGRQLGGRRVGLASAVLCALYPTLIGFSHYLWSETIYLIFALGSLALLTDDYAPPHLWKLVAAGAGLGLAALTREVGLVLIGVVPLALVSSSRWALRDRVRSAGVLMAAAALVVAPWSAHLSERDWESHAGRPDQLDEPLPGQSRTRLPGQHRLVPTTR